MAQRHGLMLPVMFSLWKSDVGMHIFRILPGFIFCCKGNKVNFAWPFETTDMN